MRTWPALEVGRLKPAATPQEAPTTDLLQATLLDYKVVAIDESTSDAWRVFFTTDEAMRALAEPN